MALTYVHHKKISLKRHPEFDEKWLQDRVGELEHLQCRVKR